MTQTKNELIDACLEYGLIAKAQDEKALLEHIKEQINERLAEIQGLKTVEVAA